MASFGGGGRTDRVHLGKNHTSANTTSVLWSLIMQVTDLTNTGATGVTIFGFNNTAQTLANHDTAAQPSTISGRLTIKPGSLAGKYVVGAGKASGSVGDWDWADATELNVGDTVYLVARYSYNTASTTDDVFDLWVNPSPATFGDDSLIPAPDATATAGNDGGTIATIILRQFGTALPAGMLFDEIRVDTTWAHATSNLIPEPSAAGLLAAGAVSLLARRRK
jgi:hypothetical protein